MRPKEQIRPSITVASLASRVRKLELHSRPRGEELSYYFHTMKEWMIPFSQSFDNYFTKFNSYFSNKDPSGEVDVPLFDTTSSERITQHFEDIIGRNRITSLILASREYEKVVEDEKDLRGKDTALGISKCIDGRLSTLWAEGRAMKVHETMAGLLETEEIEKPDHSKKTILKDTRLSVAIIDEAQRGPVLEILLAHTDLSDPHHGCGAMMQDRTRHPDKYPEGTDLVLANLNQHKKAALAIDTLYNDAAEPLGKKQEKTAITAVYDTATMGLVLGYGEENKGFSTTDIAREMEWHTREYLINQDGKELHTINDYAAGIIRGKLEDPEYIIENEKLINGLSRTLLNANNPFYQQIQSYIENHVELSLLSAPQQKALRFYLARTTALQYLSGAYNGNHPYSDHNEIMQSVSTDGAAVGQFMPDQVFCANPNDDGIIDHIITQTNIMGSNRSTPKQTPYLLFVAGVLSEDQDVSSAERARGYHLDLCRKILYHPQIQQAIMDQKLLLVPVMIDGKTRDLKEILNGVGLL